MSSSLRRIFRRASSRSKSWIVNASIFPRVDTNCAESAFLARSAIPRFAFAAAPKLSVPKMTMNRNGRKKEKKSAVRSRT